ncbi:response regulator transcription factor [Nocardioides korecus]
MRILLAEDDVRLAALLEETLTEAGWKTDVVHDGRAAYDRLLRDPSYDVALLDWMLPGMDGVTVSRRLRDLGLSVPVLMLTARGDVRDRIEGLDAGADDYMPKPFDLDELLARLRALYRRGGHTEDAPLRVDDLTVDPGSRRVTRGATEISMSAREFDILHLLADHAGHVVTRQDVLDEVWDGETDLRSNVIDVHLAAIRAKIDKPFGRDSITTVRGVGFRLDPTAAPAG